jgi:Uncharacterized protein containing a TIR (Toll-Interleukin 1-resistance) domain
VYNLLVSADCEAWDGRHAEPPRARCLRSYSDEALTAKHSDLNEDDCSFLMSLPCLFAYEIPCEKNARVGRITRIRTKQDRVRIDYEIREDAAEISPEQILELSWDLGLGTREMNHTHWAVKQEDLSAALAELKLIASPGAGTGRPLVDVTQHIFDVSLSFPGEARAYVEAVALELVKVLGHNRVFYDNFYKSQLARPNLDTLLQDIYGERSKLIVVFLSQAYGDKPWCGIEFRPIREIISTKKDEMILYIKTGEGRISGVFSTDGFIDAATHTPPELVPLIVERLKLISKQMGGIASPQRHPVNADQIAEIRPAIHEAIKGAPGICVTLQVTGETGKWIQIVGQEVNAAYPHTMGPEERVKVLPKPGHNKIVAWEPTKFATFEFGRLEPTSLAHWIDAYFVNILNCVPGEYHLDVVCEDV